MLTLRLPAETLHAIILTVIAGYLDDVIVGHLSLAAAGDGVDPAASSSNPVAALLAVSYQVRQVTLKVLSNSLAISIIGHRVGRFAVGPWRKIQPVHELCARNATDRPTDVELTALHGELGQSPSLHVYAMVHAVSYQLQVTRSIRAEAVAAGKNVCLSERFEEWCKEDDVLAWWNRAEDQYELCPPAVQGVMAVRMRECHSQITIAVMYEMTMEYVIFAWSLLRDRTMEGTADIEDDTTPAQMLPFLLLNMHKIDAAMVEIWDDEVLDLDSDVLGPDRLALWCYYFRAIASFERESADIGDARATAQDLFNSFTKRLCKITLSSRAQTDVCTVA